MDYINKFTTYINSLFLPSDENGHGNDQNNDNDQNDGNKNLRDIDIDQNNIKIINEIKKNRICTENHAFGYSPYFAGGPCRFCWGKK